jgi:hypothetical protein
MLTHLTNIKTLLAAVFLPVLIAPSWSLPNDDETYKEAIKTWHRGRMERLMSEDGWLTLVGLYWLKNGRNSFGSAEENDLVFPLNAPDRIGYFQVENNHVSVAVDSSARITIDGQQVTNAVLQSDRSENVTVMRNATLSWYLIEREGKLGIRVKDSASAALATFRGIEAYAIDPAWRIPAKLQRSAAPEKVRIPTVLGNDAEETSPGHLMFEVGGIPCRLVPLTTTNPDELFVIFGDETNGVETYGGGRFVYIEAPDTSGLTFIDFNKAYNPPCAFNEFSTCPLPPPENILPIAVHAGEKVYKE